MRPSILPARRASSILQKVRQSKRPFALCAVTTSSAVASCSVCSPVLDHPESSPSLMRRLRGGISARQVWELDDASNVYSPAVESKRRKVARSISALRESDVDGESTLSEAYEVLVGVLSRLFGEDVRAC